MHLHRFVIMPGEGQLYDPQCQEPGCTTCLSTLGKQKARAHEDANENSGVLIGSGMWVFPRTRAADRDQEPEPICEFTGSGALRNTG